MQFTTAGLFLIGLVLGAMFIVVGALSRSRAGQWVLGVGAVLLALLVCFVGLFFVRTVSVPPSVRTERFVEVHGDPYPLETRAAEKPAVAPVASTTTEFAASAPPSVPVATTSSAAPPSAPRPGAGRPAWMDAPMGRDGDVYRTIATAGPYSTAAECNEKLPEALEDAVHHYIERLLGADASRRVRLPLAFIHERIVRGEWLEQAEFSFGPMYNLHQRLEFDASAAREIERRYRASLVASRVNYTGVSAALALGFVAVFFSYFKLDTLTRGYYTGRLRVAAGAVILAEAAIVGLLVNGNIGF